MTTLADRMLRARKQRKWTQEELESASGVSRETIAKIESGITLFPRRKNIIKLAKALKCTEAWLLFGESPIENNGDNIYLIVTKLMDLSADKRKMILDIIDMAANKE